MRKYRAKGASAMQSDDLQFRNVEFDALGFQAFRRGAPPSTQKNIFCLFQILFQIVLLSSDFRVVGTSLAEPLLHTGPRAGKIASIAQSHLQILGNYPRSLQPVPRGSSPERCFLHDKRPGEPPQCSTSFDCPKYSPYFPVAFYPLLTSLTTDMNDSAHA